MLPLQLGILHNHQKVPQCSRPCSERYQRTGNTGIGIPAGSTGAWLSAPAACVPGAVIPACGDAAEQHQGGRETPGTDPGPPGEDGSLLPWQEFMTRLAKITRSLSGILLFPQAPPCSALFHELIFGSGNCLFISASLFSGGSGGCLLLLRHIW